MYISLKKVFKSKALREAHLQADIAKCMDLGLNKLMKTVGGSNYPSASVPKNKTISSTGGIKKTEIEKTHSWDDLKDKF